MKYTFLTLLFLLVLTVCCRAAEPSPADFNVVGKSAERISEPDTQATQLAIRQLEKRMQDIQEMLTRVNKSRDGVPAAPGRYLTYEQAFAKCRAENKDMRICRRCSPEQVTQAAADAARDGLIFGVADDNDTRMVEGVSDHIFLPARTNGQAPTRPGVLPPGRKPIGAPGGDIIDGPPPVIPAPRPQACLPTIEQPYFNVTTPTYSVPLASPVYTQGLPQATPVWRQPQVYYQRPTQMTMPFMGGGIRGGGGAACAT